MTVIDTLRDERDQARDAAIALAETDDFDPESTAFKELESRAASLDKQIEHLGTLLDKRQAADALDGRLSRVQQRQQERSAEQPQTRESWGEAWVRSEQFAQYPGRGTSQRLQVETRALPHSLDSMGDAIRPGPVLDTTPAPLPPSLLPLVTVVNVTGNSIDYITWSRVGGTAGKSSAAIVPEAGDKPPIEFAPSVTSASLDTIAASTSYTRQLAQDAAAVVSYINGELQNEVRRKIEEEAQAALAAASLASVTGSDLLVALRMGMAAVQAAGFVPNGFTVSADDWAAMDIAAMNASNSGPTGASSFWGLRPVVDWTKSAGDPITVGDFKRAVQHYSRTTVELFTTDSHADHFTKNILDSIAEARCKTVVVRPDALVEATVAP